MFLPAKHNENNEEKKVQINPLNTLPEIYNFAKKLRFKVGVDKKIDIKLAYSSQSKQEPENMEHKRIEPLPVKF